VLTRYYLANPPDRGRGSHQGTRRRALGVLQRRLPVLSSGPRHYLPPRNDIRAHRRAVAPKQAPLRDPSGSGPRLVGQTGAPGQATDAQHARQRVVFFQAFHNIVRPHINLRQQLPLHEHKRSGALRPRWWERTPPVAAGLTDYVWTFVNGSRPNMSRSMLKVSDEYQK
jgi:hypothetical protein